MRKNDLKQVDHLARRFGVDRVSLAEYIRYIKTLSDGNPNLHFGRNGSIYLGNEPVGDIQDLTPRYAGSY